MARAIEVWPISRLKPYERNARTHSPEQIEQTADSIRKFGFLNPILVDSSAGIVAGHGRTEAAKKLKLKEVPVIVLDHLSDDERRAFILADNRIAQNAGWDYDLLQEELQHLSEMNFDLELTGFDESEIAKILEAPGTKDAPESFKEHTASSITTDYRCPKCTFEWSGKPR